MPKKVTKGIDEILPGSRDMGDFLDKACFLASFRANVVHKIATALDIAGGGLCIFQRTKSAQIFKWIFFP